MVARINDLVRAVPAGANGVTFLPFLSGEPAPFVAPHTHASFNGLSARSTNADMARAVMEGTAFSLKHCFRSSAIKSPGQAFLTGGGARNPIWCEILASVLGTTIVASDASNHGLWGAAMIAASAAGLRDLTKHQPRSETTHVYEPDARIAREYDRLFTLYERIVAVSRQIWAAQREAGRYRKDH